MPGPNYARDGLKTLVAVASHETPPASRCHHMSMV